MSSTLETVKQPKQNQPQATINKKGMNLATSWYIAMPSKDLGKKPKTIELFGQPLVAWRNQNGHPVIMERYCSHMGASLAIGKVVDGCIQCPFHHWRYDGSGQCVSIPEIEYIPPKAHQAIYVTAERYGYIWVWYGSQTPLFSLPEFSSAEDNNYTLLRSAYNAETTLRQLVEANTCDYFHLLTLHKQKAAGSIKTTVLDEEHSAPQSQSPIQKEACITVLMEIPAKGNMGHSNPLVQVLGLGAETFTLQFELWPSGAILTHFADGKEWLKGMFCTTPVAENKNIVHYLTTVKKTGNFFLDTIFRVIVSSQAKTAAVEDMSIFNTLKSDASRAFFKHDIAILKYREFYQRWVDKVE